jgi:predicted amidohydrolase YtcJ
MPTNKALKRAAEIGIAFVTQPIFQYAEIETYLKNLGPERTKKTYPVQSMLKAGIPGVGQHAVGYQADFIVLDQDILDISTDKIDDISVEETYIGGNLVYKKQ